MKNQSISLKTDSYSDTDFFLSLLLGNTEEIVIVLDVNLNVALFNTSAVNYVRKWMGNELRKNYPIFDYSPPYMHDHLRNAYEKALQGESVLFQEHVPSINDGLPLYFQTKVQPAYDQHQVIKGLITITTDITARKTTEQALERNEERLRFAMEGSKQGLWDWNLQTNECFFSDSYKKLYGFDPEEISDRLEEWAARVHPEDVDLVNKAIERHMQSRDPLFECVYRVKDKMENYRWILARGLIIERNEDLQPVRMLGTHTDITEQKSGEEQYKLLFHHNPLSCWIYDPSTLKFLEVNEAATRNMGYSRDEFQKLTLFEIHPPEQHDLLRTRIKEEQASSLVSINNWRHRKKSGEIIITDIITNAIQYKGMAARMVVVHDVTSKAITEGELRRSNERFSLAAQASSEALWEWNTLTGEVYISDAYTAMFGWKVTDSRSFEEWHQYIHPEDSVDTIEGYYAIVNDPGRNRWEKEYRYLKTDGTYATVYDKAVILRDDSGKAIKVIGAIQDITRQKAVEQELRQSNMRFALASKASSDAIYDWDFINNGLYWGEGLQTLFGYQSEQVQIKTWVDLIHPEDRQKINDGLFLAMNNPDGKFWKEQYRFLKADGTYSYVLDKGYFIRDIEGKALRMIGAMQDITDLKAKEKELIRSNERYEHAILATSDIIWDWDLETNEFLWSENMKKVLGWTLPEGRSMHIDLWLGHIHPEDKERVMTSLRSFVSDKSQVHWHQDFRYQRPDGTYAYVSDKAYTIRDHSGKAMRMIGAMQDISERHYQEELLTLERSIFELSTNGSIPFLEVLKSLLTGVEKIHPEAFTSVQLLREDQTIEQIAAPRLHPDFKQAIDGLKIDEHSGSCGAAMILKKTVIVSDIQTDPLWKNFKGLAGQFELRSSWSLPVIHSSGKVMGSFAVYHKTIKQPTQNEMNTIERVRNIIRVLMENHYAIEEIKKANERFDAILQATHDLIWDWNMDTSMVYRDPLGLQKVYGVADNNTIVEIAQWMARLHPEDLPNIQAAFIDILNASPQETFDMEYRFQRDDGTYSYVYDRGKIIRNAQGRPLRMIGAAQDITERKKLEQILIHQELERQKAINQATVDTQEQERSEIGKELHDNVNQVLTTTKLYLDLALSNPEMKDELIKKSTKNILNVINEIRQLSRSLMDPTIGDLGLVDSIRDLIENINLTRKLNVTLDIDETIEMYLDTNQKLTTFRIIQEALNNAIRHAKASTVAIKIETDVESIHMTIQDNGIGFLPQTVKKGAGLKNIQNRVYLIDGTHTIESAPKMGCKIIINYPINKNSTS